MKEHLLYLSAVQSRARNTQLDHAFFTKTQPGFNILEPKFVDSTASRSDEYL